MAGRADQFQHSAEMTLGIGTCSALCRCGRGKLDQEYDIGCGASTLPQSRSRRVQIVRQGFRQRLLHQSALGSLSCRSGEGKGKGVRVGGLAAGIPQHNLPLVVYRIFATQSDRV